MMDFKASDFELWINRNKHGISGIESIRTDSLAMLYMLDRICDKIESVSVCLESLQDPLESLDKCIEHPKQGRAFLNVVGDISMRS